MILGGLGDRHFSGLLDPKPSTVENTVLERQIIEQCTPYYCMYRPSHQFENSVRCVLRGQGSLFIALDDLNHTISLDVCCITQIASYRIRHIHITKFYRLGP